MGNIAFVDVKTIADMNECSRGKGILSTVKELYTDREVKRRSDRLGRRILLSMHVSCACIQ